MTEIKFYKQGATITGFVITGHSTSSADDFEGKLVCSAVSSAAYMAANTLLEIVKAKAFTEVKDGYMRVELSTKLEESQTILQGFLLHSNELAKQYRNYLKVYSEV